MDNQNRDPANQPVVSGPRVLQPTADILREVQSQPAAPPVPSTVSPSNPAASVQPALASVAPPPPSSPINIVSGGFQPPSQDSSGNSFSGGVVSSMPNPVTAPAVPVNPTFPDITNDDDSYESNPFLVTIKGLIQVLRYNAACSMLSQVLTWAISIVAVVLFLIVLFAIKSPIISSLLIIVCYCLLVPLFSGLHFSVAAESIKQQKVTLGETWSRSLSKLLPLLGLLLLTGLLTIIGFVLLIIPGLLFIARSSLAPIAMFEEDLGPIASLKSSFELTKGHTFEMLGAFFAASWLGGGALLLPAISTAPLVGRYQDLKKLKATDGPKPKVHWLNYLVFIVLLFAVIGTIGLVFAIKHAANSITTSLNGVSTSTSTGFSSDGSSSSSSSSGGEQLNTKGTTRPSQYLQICTTPSDIEYVTQGSPQCLGSDSYEGSYSAGVPGTLFSSPCESTTGTVRYVYISENESCPDNTKLVFYNNL